jgi:hypothetical protein
MELHERRIAGRFASTVAAFQESGIGMYIRTGSTYALVAIDE